ncbi:MAG: hypothetical protein NTV80_09305 [Verrucomicrobia bacterium]|nr:hypothetical protein [Verrucomicrobiota bacterium]
MPCFQFAFLVVMALATTAFSQATFPTPTLTSLTPLGSKANTHIELTLRGADLDAPIAILLNERSIPVIRERLKLARTTPSSHLAPTPRPTKLKRSLSTPSFRASSNRQIPIGSSLMLKKARP